MTRLKTYAGVSVIATLAVIYHAFSSRGQFYPAMVYLSTSKISLVLLLNMALAVLCVLWQLTRKIFLGPLREAEVERLNEQSWREIMEILFAITIFRQDFSVAFLAMVTALLFVKALHWLAQKRVEYIETTPTVTKLSHIRIVSFMGFLLLMDSLFLYNYMSHLIQTRKASVSLFFAFEYLILATTTVATFVKYVFYVTDMLMEGQWEKKAVYTFYLELIRDLVHLTMYLCFFLMIFINYGVPLHLIRELYETFRNFKIRISDYIRYRKITSNMNDRFPDATPEELNRSDAICIICREEMTTAKKLICGHLFHVNCLRSWLERQHTCPTCRALVVPPENGTNVAGSQSDAQRGTGISTTSQGSQADPRSNSHVSQHQARLQAAAAAAAIYEKSFVYPSAPTQLRSHGYDLVPPPYRPAGSSLNVDSEGGRVANEQSEQHQSVYRPFAHYSQCSFGPSQYPGVGMPYGGSNLSTSDTQLEAHRILLQQQIEVLQSQLMLLQTSNTQKAAADAAGVSDSKGKAVSLENAQDGQSEAADI